MELKNLLKKYDISQSRLGRKIGYTNAQVGNWVKGEHLPPKNKYPLIAEAIGCTLEELVQALKG